MGIGAFKSVLKPSAPGVERDADMITLGPVREEVGRKDDFGEELAQAGADLKRLQDGGASRHAEFRMPRQLGSTKTGDAKKASS